jgi:hypothetical protein
MKRLCIVLTCGALLAALAVLDGCATQTPTRVVSSSQGLVEEPTAYQESDPCLSFLEEFTYNIFKGLGHE